MGILVKKMLFVRECGRGGWRPNFGVWFWVTCYKMFGNTGLIQHYHTVTVFFVPKWFIICVGWDIKPYSFTRFVFVLGTLPTPPARMKCSSVPVHVVVSGLVFSPWDLYQTSVISRMDTPMQATPTPQFRYIGTVFQDTLWSAPWSCSEILQSVNLGVPRSFAVSGPTSWNSITQSFRDATPTLGQFQRRL